MVASKDDARRELDELLWQFAQGSGSAKKQIRTYIAREAGVEAASVAISSARGGTKQARNRLGQAEVQRGSELTIFLLDETDPIEASLSYVVDAVRGRNDARPPAGPVVFVVPRSSEPTLVGMVEGRPTGASRWIRDLYGVSPTDPRDSLSPQVPPDGSRWLLMSSGETLYGDMDGIRYHFPTSIPNGRQVQAGDFVVTGRTKGSGTADAGCVFGLGRVGRRVDVSEGRHAFVYFDRYLEISPPMPLDDLGDPRTNVNSIVSLEPAWLVELMKVAGVESVEELPVPITALSLDRLVAGVERDGLVFDPSLLARVLAAIRSGKHVMLTGAPGTGKTSLALAMAEAAREFGLCQEALLTTGTADWTSADTVGAYRLTKDQELRFHPGHVVVALEEDRWLIIDELNRADIDKAIGQLFTALSGQAVTLPFEEHDVDTETDLPISIVPPGQAAPIGTAPKQIARNWRLIATLNDRDRDLLFDMSEALMRRFAVVEVPTPTPPVWRKILERVGGTGRAEWDQALENLVSSPELSSRPLGAAVLLDAVYHLREIGHLYEELDTDVDLRRALQEALDIYVKPQLRTLAASVTVDAASLLPKSVPASNAAGGADAGEQ